MGNVSLFATSMAASVASTAPARVGSAGLAASLGALRLRRMRARRHRLQSKWRAKAVVLPPGPGRTWKNVIEAAASQRADLRRRPRVEEELEKWWTTISDSMRSPGRAVGTAIGKEAYVQVSRLVTKALEVDFDTDDAQAIAEDDWAHDTRGAAELPRERFLDGLLELADIQIQALHEEATVEFLGGLFQRISTVDSEGRWCWRDEGDVTASGTQELCSCNCAGTDLLAAATSPGASIPPPPLPPLPPLPPPPQPPHSPRSPPLQSSQSPPLPSQSAPSPLPPQHGNDAGTACDVRWVPSEWTDFRPRTYPSSLPGTVDSPLGASLAVNYEERARAMPRPSRSPQRARTQLARPNSSLQRARSHLPREVNHAAEASDDDGSAPRVLSLDHTLYDFQMLGAGPSISGRPITVSGSRVARSVGGLKPRLRDVPWSRGPPSPSTLAAMPRPLSAVCLGGAARSSVASGAPMLPSERLLLRRRQACGASDHAACRARHSSEADAYGKHERELGVTTPTLGARWYSDSPSTRSLTPPCRNAYIF